MFARSMKRPADPMQAHIIRVYSFSEARTPTFRYAVLATDTREAMAAVIGRLDLCDTAEVTHDVLDPALAEQIGLQPGQPHRLP